MTTLDLNDLWVLYNYNLKSVSPCDNKKCDCDIQFIKNQEYQKLLSSVFFSLLFCAFRLDKKEDNQFWFKIKDLLELWLWDHEVF